MPDPASPDWAGMLGSVQFTLAFQHYSGPKFNGDPRKFRKYQKDIQRMYIISGGSETDSEDTKLPRLKQIAYFLSTGTVAEAIRRRMLSDPSEKWDSFMQELTTRYSPIQDANCAQAILRSAKRKKNQSVQDWSEWLLEIASESFPGVDLANDPAVQFTLIDVFLRGLDDPAMHKKCIKDLKDTTSFADLVKIASGQQRLNRRIQAHIPPSRRSGTASGSTFQAGGSSQQMHGDGEASGGWQDPSHESMEIGAVGYGTRGRGGHFGRRGGFRGSATRGRGQSRQSFQNRSVQNANAHGNVQRGFHCYSCFEPNSHFAAECPNKNITCHNCKTVGHKAKFCPNPYVVTPHQQINHAQGQFRGNSRGQRSRGAQNGTTRGRGRGQHQGRGGRALGVNAMDVMQCNAMEVSVPQAPYMQSYMPLNQPLQPQSQSHANPFIPINAMAYQSGATHAQNQYAAQPSISSLPTMPVNQTVYPINQLTQQLSALPVNNVTANQANASGAQHQQQQQQSKPLN